MLRERAPIEGQIHEGIIAATSTVPRDKDRLATRPARDSYAERWRSVMLIVEKPL